MIDLNELYCLKVTRTGAAGIAEEAGDISLHAITHDDLDGLLDLVVRSLGPGDRAEIILTRGQELQ